MFPLDEEIKRNLKIDFKNLSYKQQINNVSIIIHRCFQEIFQKASDEKALAIFFRKWLLTCHPSLRKIRKDFVFNEKLIISAKVMQSVNELSKNMSTFKNNGLFCSLLHKAYHDLIPYQEVLSKPIFNLASFETWFESFIYSNPNHYTVLEDNTDIDINFESIIYQQLSLTQYYVGFFKEWFEYQLKIKIDQLMQSVDNKDSFYHSLKKTIKFQEAVKLLPEKVESLTVSLEPLLVNAKHASLKYHFMRAAQQLSNPIVLSLPKIKDKVLKNSFVLTEARKARIYKAHLYICLWQILYADPTRLENFNMPEYLSIPVFSDRSYTDEQYHSLRDIFLGDNALLSQLKVETNIISFLKSKINCGTNSNWLLQALNWTYGEGGDAAIGFSWILDVSSAKNSPSKLVSNAPFRNKVDKGFEKLYNRFLNAIKPLSLTKIIGKYTDHLAVLVSLWIILPCLYFTGISYCIFHSIGIALQWGFALGLSPFLAYALSLEMEIMFYICVDSLRDLAQCNHHFDHAVPKEFPEWLKIYHNKVIAPLWRISAKPIESIFRPIGILWSFILSLLATASFMIEKIALSLSNHLLTFTTLFTNLPFSAFSPAIDSDKPSNSVSSFLTLQKTLLMNYEKKSNNRNQEIAEVPTDHKKIMGCPKRR